jgi:hypothetical protein
VSVSSSIKPASTFENSQALQTSVAPIASYLSESAGAQFCYLALVERPGQSLLLIATRKPVGDAPSWRAIDGLALTRRALAKGSILLEQTHGYTALALPLLRDTRAVGVALLLARLFTGAWPARSTSAR